jgi:hypothetical protein
MRFVIGDPPKIEILAPFGAAFEWMKAMLFRPFDLSRWLTIAFAAFLAGNWGSGINFQWNQSGGDWNYHLQRNGDLSNWTIPSWLIALIVIGILLVIVLGFVWTWVASRGEFIFTDCIVRNRAAIAEPWREYRREGNSLFLFSLAVGFAILVLTAILILTLVVLSKLLSQYQGSTIAIVSGWIISGFLWIVALLFITLVSHFMVPVMYRRRCRAWEAFVDVTGLMFRNPAPFILFVLFGIALAIAVGVVGTAVTCVTCCVGGLPYISTVLLLPAIVWIGAYKLLFLRQFGDQYDVWAAVALLASTTQPSAPPPADPAG